MDDAKPLPQGLVGVLENSPYEMGEPIRNTARAIHALPFKRHGFEAENVGATATRATHAIGPTPGDKIRFAGVLVREQIFKLDNRELMNWLRTLAGHGSLPSMEGT